MQTSKYLKSLLAIALAGLISSCPAWSASTITEMGGEEAVSQATPGSTGKAKFSGPESSQAKSAPDFTVTFTPPTEAQKRAPAPKSDQKSGGGLLVGIGLKNAEPDINPLDLQWITIADDRRAGRLRINSRGAESVRAALVIGSDSGTLPEDLILHFKGTDDDIFEVTGKELKNNQLYWSPIVVGDAVTVELVLPAGIKPESLHLAVPQLSWFSASYKDAKAGYSRNFGESESCETDAVCSVQRGNPGYDNAMNAVAKTLHTEANGFSFMCTGTLLNNSNSPKRQLLWSAAHCALNQAEADTYQTVWFYATTQCNGDASTIDPRVAVLTGGATILYRHQERDTLLLELKRTPPAGVFYQGWNAQQIANGSDIHDLHHPSGDATKYSQGNVTGLGLSTRDAQTNNVYTNLIRVQWPTAVVEKGSSGSGLLTIASDGAYQLRGGLFGGPSSCSASTNRRYDYFSDFSGVFQQISGYFAP